MVHDVLSCDLMINMTSWRRVAPLATLVISGCAAAPQAETASSSDAIVSASTLFVSDIDDTIKQTAVRGGTSVVGGALGSTNEFAGMSILYQHWRKKDAPKKEIRYLTAAPGDFDELGSSFLTFAGFPGNGSSAARDAVISGRSFSEESGDFKAQKLEALFDGAAPKPTLTILVGDNGEQDMIAYSRLMDHAQQTGSTTRIVSFIHHVYESQGKPIVAPHQPWLTAADLAVRFYNESWIDEASLTAVLNEVEVDSGDRSLSDWVVPSFMECGGFDAWPTIERPSTEQTRALYAKAKTNVIQLCGGR